MQSFNFSSYLDLFSTYDTLLSILAKLAGILGLGLYLYTIVGLIVKNTRHMFPTFDKRVENMNTSIRMSLMLGHLVFPFFIAIVVVNMSATALDKKYHNDNTIVLPTTTLIALDNPDEYTLQLRHAKPVEFRFQDGHTEQASLVDVSAKQVLTVVNTVESVSYLLNNIVKLPLDKADDIQTGDRVTTAKKVLHVDYTGKKAFKLHVTKIERPVSVDKTQWHTVYEAK